MPDGGRGQTALVPGVNTVFYKTVSFYVLGVIFRTTYWPSVIFRRVHGAMALVSYLDTARRLASFLAKKTRFVTTSNR